jgi:mannose-1-phosphate guanylyltransferase
MNCISWAVLLAGGDGKRLLPLTRRLCGEERPKQFAPLLGGRSLLTLTKERLAPLIAPEKTLFAVVERHRRFYEVELSGISPTRIVVQPDNRGTSAAIAYSLLRIARTDPDAIVGFFPTDHYYADEAGFTTGVKLACEIVRQQQQFLVLLGATPEWADADYGWIEPGVCLERSSNTSLFRVNRFWEKPSVALAEKLHKIGCLLNTFVMIAHARTFHDLMHATIPDVLRAFALLNRRSSTEAADAHRIYSKLPCGDFSQQVLSARADRLLALRLADVGWSDLGTEDRVNAVIARSGGSVHRPAFGSTRLDAEPQSLEDFHAWLEAYRKRLWGLCESTARRESAAR